MIVVFSKEWFKKYNKQLCLLANSFIGNWVFKFTKFGHDLEKYGKITEIHPNAITHKQRLLYDFEKRETRQEYTTQFFSRNEYALRLQKVFYPIWITFHIWDMFIANKFKPAWNLGFDTLTVYPGSSSADDPIEGYVERNVSSETWATIRESAGNNANHTLTSAYGLSMRPGATTDRWDIIKRTVALFDTSALPDDSTISATVLSYYITEKADPLSISFGVVSSNPASTTDLTNGDYDYNDFGTTRYNTSDYSFGSVSLAAYNDFTFNATGRAAVSKTSLTKLSLRCSNDIDNSAPTWVSGLPQVYIRYNTADNASNKPKLVVTYTVVIAKILTETITTTDSIEKKANKIISETLTITDSIIKKAIKIVSETINIADSIVRKTTKAISDTITITDNVYNSIARTLTETITLTESFTKLKIKFKSISETINITDVIIKIPKKLLSESITITETITKASARILSDTLTITEDFCTDVLKILNETISVTENFVKTAILSRTFTETINIAESFVKIPTKIISDIITIAESITVKTSRILSETISIVEDFTKIITFTRILSETITITEAFIKIPVKIMSEAITITESITKVAVLKKTLTEAISMTEQLYGKINGVNIKWFRKYSEKVGSFTRKYSEKVGTFYNKYFKDI